MDFLELNLTLNEEVHTIEWNDTTPIAIKNYLPVNEKLDLISWIINQSADDLKFYNVGKLDIFKTIGIIQHYTNIVIADEDLSDPAHLYDLFVASGLMTVIVGVIPTSELTWIDTTLRDTVESVYKYQNSVMGILEAVTTDYNNLNFDVEQLQKNIADPNNLTLLKDVMTKLG